jgi:hypothetical protein
MVKKLVRSFKRRSYRKTRRSYRKTRRSLRKTRRSYRKTRRSYRKLRGGASEKYTLKIQEAIEYLQQLIYGGYELSEVKEVTGEKLRLEHTEHGLTDFFKLTITYYNDFGEEDDDSKTFENVEEFVNAIGVDKISSLRKPFPEAYWTKK